MILTLATIISWTEMILLGLLLVWVIISWMAPRGWNHPIAMGVNRVIQPILAPFRPLLPGGPLDISPLLAAFMIMALCGLLIRLLVSL